MFTLTNINAMNAAQAVTRSHAYVQTSMERLSTGSRINAARDDAAGLAMSQRMAAQIIGINKAIDNASDGVGLLNTADGALEEVSGLLQRMRELSVQAANGSANSEDRGFLNSEYQQLKSEIDRIGAQTEWNGMRLLDGSVFKGATAFQVGANTEQTIDVAIGKLSTRTIAKSSDLFQWAQLGTDISGESVGDGLGTVSISDDGLTVAIGANGNSASAGHVRVYRFNPETANWAQVGADIDGEAAGDLSGQIISMSGDGSTVAIGAPRNGDYNSGTSTSDGHVRIYKYDASSGSWIQRGSDIDGSETNAFGSHLSLSADGSTLSVGTGGSPNSTRVYRYDSSAGNWVQKGSDITSFSGGAPSSSLSNDGTRLAISDHNAGGSSRGQVRIFDYDASSASWVQVGGNIDGEASSDHSGGGTQLALSGDGSTVAIGAYQNDASTYGSNTGHVRVFQYQIGSASWVQIGNDIDGEAYGDGFGYSVSISDDGTVVAAGALNHASGRGHARLYEYDSSSSSWAQLGSDIDGNPANSGFGSTVSISSDGATVATGSVDSSNISDVGIFQDKYNLHGTQVTSQASADRAIVSLDAAIKNVSSMRSKYGAATNQLTHAIDNLTEVKINAESSMSRIKDADYATETSRLAANQIINEAATAMLAQANNSQELTMSLIKDWL